jgi:hypothetical protein
MRTKYLPEFIRLNYEIHEWRHAQAILRCDFPQEYSEIVDVLMRFRLLKNWLTVGGGRKSKVSEWIDGELLNKHQWVPKGFDTKIIVDEQTFESPTHEVDCFKNRVALEIEWNNKDPFFDRDLNNFRLLFELRAISVGVILIFDTLRSYLLDLQRLTTTANPLGTTFSISSVLGSCLLPQCRRQGNSRSHECLVRLPQHLAA